MDVSVLGRIGYDLYADQQGLPLKDVSTFSRYLGGSSANIAVGLARLGLQVGIISCIGDDALGDYLLEYLQKESVDTRFVSRSLEHRSSLCLTEVSPPDRFPQVFYRDQAADIQVQVGDAEKQLIAGTRLFVTNGTSLCGSPSRESTFRALEWAHQNGVTVAFDVDYRAMSWKGPEEAALYTRLALPFVDVFIANPEELRLVAETPETESAMNRLQDLGVPLLVAKLGSAGTRVRSAQASLFLPPYPVNVVSTIGAGDGFAAGFLYALVDGKDLETSLRYGNAAAAMVVGQVMCSEAMPRVAEVEQLIQSHPEIKAVTSSPAR